MIMLIIRQKLRLFLKELNSLLKTEKSFQFLNHIGIQGLFLLKDAFSKAFAKSDLVLVCPLYAAGEKKNSKFDNYKFAELISKNSKKQTVLVKSEIELANFLKRT